MDGWLGPKHKAPAENYAPRLRLGSPGIGLRLQRAPCALSLRRPRLRLVPWQVLRSASAQGFWLSSQRGGRERA